MADASTAQPRACGACSLCCKVYEFLEISKPADQWCRHFAAGQGCTIHSLRPGQCRSYQCAWSVNPVLDETWKPNVCGFVMDVRPGEIVVFSDPDNLGAWKREPYYSRLKAVSARVQRPFTLVSVIERGKRIVVFPEAEVELGPIRGGEEINSGYEVVDGKRVPYARYVDAAAPS